MQAGLMSTYQHRTSNRSWVAWREIKVFGY